MYFFILSIQEHVEDLYKFRDTFFDEHSIDTADQKNILVKEKLDKILEELNQTQGKL